MGCCLSDIMSVEKASQDRQAPPQWLSWIDVDLDRRSCWDHAQCSDCIEIQDDRITVIRKTKRRTTDGIKFAKAMSSGKYKFEINWLPIYRGSKATIGIASESTLTSSKGNVSLVGASKGSWGFDIVRKRILHDSEIVCEYPKVPGAVPTKIYMYVDMDEGNVSFGTDGQFWGIAFKFAGYDKTMYAMVGISEPFGMVQMIYNGKAVNPLQEQGAVGGMYMTGGPLEHNLGFEGSAVSKDIMLDEIDCGPSWFKSLTRPEKPSDHEFCLIDGANSPKISFFSGMVTRNVLLTDLYSTDGARTKTPITSGKHVWEVEWPADSRGTHASIGIGIRKTPVAINEKCSLVGNTSTSWGFDLGRRRMIRSKEVVMKYPPGANGAIPDMFYMFLDMDIGVLSFGSKTEYWGEAARNIKEAVKDEPLYVFVGISKPVGWVRLNYKGSYYCEQGPVGQAVFLSEKENNPDLMPSPSRPYLGPPIQTIAAPPPFEYYAPPMQEAPPSYEQSVVCDQKY